ncbi:hypothetical protein [Streptomyces sp. URMC 129]|uniref:hypothetical protein n=1 Tax=Streptomyces sp. URMC 129 TaxID=3423407 RepID=UPI003F1C41CA
MAAHAPRSGPEIRLRWWVLTLPAIAFAALLSLQFCATEARAADGPRPVTELVDHVWRSWLP